MVFLFDFQSSSNITKCLQGPLASLTHPAPPSHEPSEIGRSLYFPQTSKRQGAISLQYLGEIPAKMHRELQVVISPSSLKANPRPPNPSHCRGLCMMACTKEPPLIGLSDSSQSWGSRGSPGFSNSDQHCIQSWRPFSQSLQQTPHCGELGCWPKEVHHFYLQLGLVTDFLLVEASHLFCLASMSSVASPGSHSLGPVCWFHLFVLCVSAFPTRLVFH